MFIDTTDINCSLVLYVWHFKFYDILLINFRFAFSDFVFRRNFCLWVLLNQTTDVNRQIILIVPLSPCLLTVFMKAQIGTEKRDYHLSYLFLAKNSKKPVTDFLRALYE